MSTVDLDNPPGFSEPTRVYGQPRKPFSSPLPSLLRDVADDEYRMRLLDFAANCKYRSDDRKSLKDSDDHVLALLDLVEDLDLALAAMTDARDRAQGETVKLELELDAVRNAHQVDALELETAEYRISVLETQVSTFRAALDRFSGRGRPETTTMTESGR